MYFILRRYVTSVMMIKIVLIPTYTCVLKEIIILILVRDASANYIFCVQKKTRGRENEETN